MSLQVNDYRKNPVVNISDTILFQSSDSMPRLSFGWYVTQHAPSQEIWATEGTKISFDRQGRAVIESEMKSGAAIVFFGVQ
jgi:hypothetical protein